MAITNVDPTYEGTAARLAQQNSDWHISSDNQSDPATQNSRQGTYVYWFDYEIDGAVAGDYEMRLFREDGPAENHDLPDGFLVRSGFIHVLEAINTGSHHIDIESAADVIANGTTMNSTGIKNIVPDPSAPATTAILVDSTGVRPVMTLGGTITAGKIMLVLEGYLTNP